MEKQPGLLTYFIWLLFLAGIGVGIYYGLPPLMHKIMEVTGYYDEEVS